MGAFEEAKGRLKQAAGDLIDDETLQAEGEAQERKAEAQDAARDARADARALETEADVNEMEQRAAEQAK